MKNLLVAIVVTLLFIGCSNTPLPVKSTNSADSAEQHIVTGMNLIEDGRISSAISQCNRALALEPKNSSAYSCLAIAKNDKVLLEKADDTIENNIDKFRYYIANIRIGDIKSAKEFYDDSKDLEVEYLPYYQDKESADYFLALNYFKYLKLENTREFSGNVFKNKDAKFATQSRVLWGKVDGVIRALSLSQFTVTAKKLVLKDKIKRVDIAVVLEDEISLSKLMKGAFKADRKDMARTLSEDILNHPNLPQIEIFYKYGLRGLEPKISVGKEKFLPDSFITRADFALLLEDIVSKALSDKKLKTKFYGNVSSFSDVKNNGYYFNAINTAVARGFLKPNRNSEFRPDSVLNGVELIEAIAVIKEEIR
ncbi:S-layer homology domain-containing protein [Sulfurimonas sp.]